MWKGNKNHEIGTGLFEGKRIISAVMRVEFVSDRMSLRGCWCDAIVLSAHVQIEDNIVDVKDSFYEELE
jgi:hypothetical protein